jgi:hypothetical protein
MLLLSPALACLGKNLDHLADDSGRNDPMIRYHQASSSTRTDPDLVAS